MHLRSRAWYRPAGEHLNHIPPLNAARVHPFHVVPLHWLLPKPDDQIVLFPQSKLKPELPSWLSNKESAYQCRRGGFYPWVRKIPWRRAWQPSPLFLPGESHGQRALVGYKRVGHDSATKQQEQKFKTVGSGIPASAHLLNTREITRGIKPQWLANWLPLKSFFLFLKRYLFIWLCRVLVEAWRVFRWGTQTL